MVFLKRNLTGEQRSFIAHFYLRFLQTPHAFGAYLFRRPKRLQQFPYRIYPLLPYHFICHIRFAYFTQNVFLYINQANFTICQGYYSEKFSSVDDFFRLLEMKSVLTALIFGTVHAQECSIPSELPEGMVLTEYLPASTVLVLPNFQYSCTSSVEPYSLKP